ISVSGMLIVLVGIAMIVLGLQLINIFPQLSAVSLTLPKGVSKFLGVSTHTSKSYSHKSALIMGALTFFVPCGFTQAIQLYAMTTGSFITGALTMAVFAIGTAPGLLSLGGVTSFVKGKSSLFFKIVGLIVIAMALFNISNGLTLAGFKKNSTNNTVQVEDQNVKMESGIQVVHMIQNAQGYSPNSFTLKKDIPVKWYIKSIYPSCASSLIVDKLNIRTLLTEKEQVFEFTPKETGEIPFSCSMGM
ncbi:MAG: sulfite exporter TauE/SafE family protein, partial [Candidatus Roizmanbacteria bacterium]|nr:sulfite exporter TauE/SafE family protein [Candidatus Roizmanbacteria bacterium]